MLIDVYPQASRARICKGKKNQNYFPVATQTKNANRCFFLKSLNTSKIRWTALLTVVTTSGSYSVKLSSCGDEKANLWLCLSNCLNLFDKPFFSKNF